MQSRYREICVALITDAKEDIKSADVLLKNKFLERQGSRARYPLFRDPIKPIWIPSEEYKKHDAAKAFGKANFVLEQIMGFLYEKYNLKV